MANNLTDIMPRIVARGLLSLRQTAILPRLVNSSLSAEAGRHGDVINVPIAQKMDASDVVPSAQATSLPDSQLNHVEVRLDHWKRAGFYLTDKEMAEIEARADFVPLQMAEAVNALAAAVNQSILDLVPQFRAKIGSPGNTIFANAATPSEDYEGVTAAILARKLLNRAGAPKTGRFALIDYDTEANALALSQFSDMSKSGSASVPIDGEIGRKFGIDWFATDLPRGAANRSADVEFTVPSRVTEGSVTFKVTMGFADVAVGDVIQVSDGSEFYHIISKSAVSGNNGQTEITIDKPLVSSLSGGKLLQEHSLGVVMHRDAVALAMRPLSTNGLELGANGQIMAVTDPETGLSLRLEVSRQYKQTAWEFDVLWGVALARPELGVRLYG